MLMACNTRSTDNKAAQKLMLVPRCIDASMAAWLINSTSTLMTPVLPVGPLASKIPQQNSYTTLLRTPACVRHMLAMLALPRLPVRHMTVQIQHSTGLSNNLWQCMPATIIPTHTTDDNAQTIQRCS